jgi:putative toxin-antitoxin system antitoxin component (TIGR02293 family)
MSAYEEVCCKTSGRYEIKPGYGVFIKEARYAASSSELSEIIKEKGFTMQKVQPLFDYLHLSTEQIAKIAGVSSRTVTRWQDNNSEIGVLPAKVALELDRLIGKGTEIFGGEEHFSEWLNTCNVAFGDKKPIDLLHAAYGIELIEEALDALEYGNIM